MREPDPVQRSLNDCMMAWTARTTMKRTAPVIGTPTSSSGAVANMTCSLGSLPGRSPLNSIEPPCDSASLKTRQRAVLWQ